MKRTLVAICVLMCAVAAAALPVLSGCDSQDPAFRPPAKMGVLLNGSKEDRSYSQTHYEASKAVCEEHGLEMVCYDNVGATDELPALVEELIGQGCGIILGDTYLYEPYLKELAAAHRDVYFLNATGTQWSENYSTYIGRTYQVRYLAGIVAGVQTRTDQLGYVLAALTPETVRQLNAFTLGARSVNPKARVHVSVIGDWNDGDMAARTTTELLDQCNIDVLTLHTNSIAPLRVADERGVFTIGNNYDNSELFAGTYLTASVFDWKPLLDELVTDCLQGRFIGKHYWNGVREGVVDLAPLTDLVDTRARAAVEATRSKLMAGTYDVFYGPVVDSFGDVRVGAGENVSDDTLLYEMYWFVDGVVMEDRDHD